MAHGEVMEHVREKIAKTLWLLSHNPALYRFPDFDWAAGYVDTSKYYEAVDKILSIPEILIKDPDQSLPDCPIIPDPRLIDFEFQLAEKVGYNKALDMLKEHWVKVLPKKGK